MNLEKYFQHDGLGLAELVRREKITAKELADVFLAAVEKFNPKINAVIETYTERVERRVGKCFGAGDALARSRSTHAC